MEGAKGGDGGFEEMGGEACGGVKKVWHTRHWERRGAFLGF